MKKVLSVLLAVSMLMGISSVAFAENSETNINSVVSIVSTEKISLTSTSPDITLDQVTTIYSDGSKTIDTIEAVYLTGSPYYRASVGSVKVSNTREVFTGNNILAGKLYISALFSYNSSSNVVSYSDTSFTITPYNGYKWENRGFSSYTSGLITKKLTINGQGNVLNAVGTTLYGVNIYCTSDGQHS